MNIDLHAHILTQETMRLMRGVSAEHAPRLESTANGPILVIDQVRYANSPTGTWDVDERLAHMDATRVDAQAVAVVPFTLGYHLEPRLNTELCQVQNEQLAGLHKAHPERFFPLGCVPLQDPTAAVAEAERAIRQLGLYGLGLGTGLPGTNLDWPELEPFWTKVEELDVPIMFHPFQRLSLADLSDYYLVNFIGNPLDSTIMVGCLVFGGVLKRHPRLKLVIVHGGGFVPYQFGRFEHGWHVRQEPKVRLDEPPSTSIRRLYFDTITHSQPALEYLVGEFGAEHVVLGSDYPYDMGPDDPVGEIERLKQPSPADKENIKGGNAARLLNLGSAVSRP
jgi:aminocarboxymuconate-semialdehyde decarboxylase